MHPQSAADPARRHARAFEQPFHAAQRSCVEEQRRHRVRPQRTEQRAHAVAMRLQRLEAVHQDVEQALARGSARHPRKCGAIGLRAKAHEHRAPARETAPQADQVQPGIHPGLDQADLLPPAQRCLAEDGADHGPVEFGVVHRLLLLSKRPTRATARLPPRSPATRSRATPPSGPQAPAVSCHLGSSPRSASPPHPARWPRATRRSR